MSKDTEQMFEEFVDNAILHERRLHVENKRQMKHRGRVDLIGEVDVGNFNMKLIF